MKSETALARIFSRASAAKIWGAAVSGWAEPAHGRACRHLPRLSFLSADFLVVSTLRLKKVGVRTNTCARPGSAVSGWTDPSHRGNVVTLVGFLSYQKLHPAPLFAPQIFDLSSEYSRGRSLSYVDDQRPVSYRHEPSACARACTNVLIGCELAG